MVFICFIVVVGFYVGFWLLAFGRLEDGELNSRGFSNPWKT
jgi:hypothetical protein